MDGEVERGLRCAFQTLILSLVGGETGRTAMHGIERLGLGKLDGLRCC